MNDITNNQGIFYKIQNFFKKNTKIIIGVIFLIVIFFIIAQYYFYYQNNKILERSIAYNEIKLNSDKIGSSNLFENLSKENDFYGTLASLESIKLKLENNEIKSSYKEYLKLIENKNLNNLYKSAIAIHGAYSLLDKIDLKEKKSSLVDPNIYQNITNLLSYVDDSLESFEGLKLEILFLVSVMLEDEDNKEFFLESSKDIYQKIKENDKISSSIKERVKQIYEFQIYK
jgi:hypothetical protein